MKKLFLLLALAVFSVGLCNAAKGKCGKNLRWTLNDRGVLTISGTGDMKDYGKGDTPWKTSLVNEVEFEDGITRIGDNAFYGTKVSKVILPSTVKTIGASAFKNCRNLINVVLSSGLTEVGDNAFESCVSLVSLHIPASVKKIGQKSFAGCRLLPSVGLPYRLESIGRDAFMGCYAISTITSLPDFISSSNCGAYGLPYSSVESYWKANKASASASNQSQGPMRQNVVNNVQQNQSSSAQNVKYGESDIDKYVPEKLVNNSRTFAFIFANENYQAMQDVPYAINDGKSFEAYCHYTLGIPQNNINTYFNATNGNIKSGIQYLKDLDEAFNGDINVIVYYAGHGAPKLDTNDAYLVPIDAYTVTDDLCYSLDNLYAQLGSLKANSVKVFIDACFSGAVRTDELLAEGGRMVKVVPKKASVTGNVVVVSATSDKQTAWYHKTQGHGLFTYCLLKKLQESEGQVSMGELCDYLQEQVPQLSIVQNRVKQNPTFQSSPALGAKWKTWTVR